MHQPLPSCVSSHTTVAICRVWGFTSFSHGAGGTEFTWQCRRLETRVRSLGPEDALEEENGNQLQYSCLENPHGQRSLAGFSPRGRKALDTTDVTTCVGLVPGGLLFWSCKCVCVSSLYEGPASTDEHSLYPSAQYMSRWIW